MSTIIPASNVEHVTFCARSPPVETIRQYLLTVICLPLMASSWMPIEIGRLVGERLARPSDDSRACVAGLGRHK